MVRQQPLGSRRAVVPTGLSREFLFQPCTPLRLRYFTVPGSLARYFTVLRIAVCDYDLTEGEVPAEAFSNRAGFVNNIVDGYYATPAVPARVLVRNDSVLDRGFNAMFFGAVVECARWA